MKNIFTILAALLMTLCVWGAESADFNLNSRRISVQDGLAGNTINQLVQDADGYIWMATNNGLTRYDGYSTVNYISLSDDPRHHMEARIGRIVNDERQHLLWMSTATYQNACYDLRQSCFTDWTGCGEWNRQLNKLFLSPSGRGMFFYGGQQGIRRSQRSAAGEFSITDYNEFNATLPSDNVLMLLEDSAGNVLAPTASGLMILGRNDQPRIMLSGMQFVSAATDGQHTYLLSNHGDAVVLDTHGREVLRSHLPAMIGTVSKVNVSFVWQGRWMLFTPQATLSMDVVSGMWAIESGEAGLVGGLDQGHLLGYHFVANRDGRLLVFPDTGRVKSMDLIPKAHFTNNRGRKYHIAADREGRLFIATYGNGLFVWTPQTDALRHFSADDVTPIVRTNYLIDCLCDRGGCIWIGSEATGAYCLSVMTGATMNYVLPEPDHQGDWANAVSALSQKRDGSIIIGTREGGIYLYNPEDNTMTKRDERQSNVTGSFVDADGHLFISTRGEGLFVDRQQYQKGDPVHALPENKVAGICQDVRGRIWVGSWDGGLLMCERPVDGQPLSFKQFLSVNMNESRIKALQINSKGMLFVGTNNGLYTLDTRQPVIADVAFKNYNTANGRFAYDEVFSLYLSDDSTLWVGAAGSGVLKCSLTANDGIVVAQRITTREGLANNNVYSMVEDAYGYLWVGTEEGISRINISNSIVNTYQPSPVLLGNVATEDCALRTRSGQLLFGTNYGVIIITPQQPNRHATAMVRTHITDVHINGTSIFKVATDPADADSEPARTLLVSSMKEEGTLHLSYNQNTLSFFFSNFDYDNTQAALYQFYLEGIDRDWQPMTSANHADYSELAPGRYQFHLRSLSSANEWNEESTLTIIISQPWYNSWWAWLLYVLTACLLAWYVYRNWKDKFDLHQQMKLQRQINDFRVQFFTHITHEFRTPLAIIKHGTDKLSATEGGLGGQAATLSTIRRGTTRLLRLVNQFMEFRKASTNNLHLHLSEGDIVGLCKDIYQDFWPLAQQKAIRTGVMPFAKEHQMLFDREKVETIVYNLLSNAVKYTPEGGSVELRIALNDDHSLLTIAVEDSGPGITTSQQQVLFQPFMQGLASQGGMGIGLYTAYEMAKVHHGSLTYERSVKLGGSRFALSLPTSTDFYSADDYDTSDPTADTAERAQAEQIIRQMQPEALNDLTIAVIEDDPDMMEQICTELGVYFRINRYTNGRQGYDGVALNPPVLVVTDVMLPDMDGYEIVRRLKGSPQTSQLPVIMLTALADERHQLKAYEAGADDYMVKPCNFRLLIARAIQLIKWSRSAEGTMVNSETRTVSGEETAPLSSPSIVTTQADKVFLDKLQMFVAQHMSEEGFTVDQLAQLMAMGRTKFYGKVKDMTGMSPNKYLMDQRMTKAADLLADGELAVSEVCYRVGMQDPSYFNKCFKAHFGVVPSKYTRPSTPQD